MCRAEHRLQLKKCRQRSLRLLPPSTSATSLALTAPPRTQASSVESEDQIEVWAQVRHENIIRLLDFHRTEDNLCATLPGPASTLNLCKH